MSDRPQRLRAALLSRTFTCCLLSLAEEKSVHRECHFLVGVAVSALFTSCLTALCCVGGAAGWSVCLSALLIGLTVCDEGV